jgi:hypothetical protein
MREINKNKLGQSCAKLRSSWGLLSSKLRLSSIYIKVKLVPFTKNYYHLPLKKS